MTPHTSPRPLASGLVALVATGALLFSATPALAQGGLSTASSSVSAARASAPDALNPGQQLLAGQSIASSQSGGGYTFRMQDDGNAVVYDEVGHAVFDAGTSGRGNRLVMQEDGNVVIYSADGRALWSTGTDNETDASLIIQADGNLVVYREDGSPAWASSVNRRIPQPPFSTLYVDDALSRGHQLTSPNGLFRAVMQRDGNLVGYGPDGVVWNTGTVGTDNQLLVSDDGYAVIIGADGGIRWAADTGGVANSLTLDDRGVLTALDEDGAVLWTSQSGLPGAQMYAPNTLASDGLLRSDDGRYRAVMQGDGNFVVYGPTGAVWQTGTSGVESSFEFSKDGTAQVVAGSGAVTWTATPAGGTAPFRLVMQSDGNLVEYDAHHHAVWSSR
ncbi:MULTISPECIES: hypothetical protein [unclassified Rathayibacter]|uniref:hypothetical protein n=1 Tax=unclassified Rathayibacter TaxID=2609250 RepID=UPI000F4C775E|nr:MULTISPECIES: hypothetical protein [unclassified Rathayibacter]ROP57868.1 D-mannose binding lectin [Rathayibacter sp. PhB186]ROS56253.1 D-mannose binding lectin [Rathayibacter sp. PhB185]